MVLIVDDALISALPLPLYAPWRHPAPDPAPHTWVLYREFCIHEIIMMFFCVACSPFAACSHAALHRCYYWPFGHIKQITVAIMDAVEQA